MLFALLCCFLFLNETCNVMLLLQIPLVDVAIESIDFYNIIYQNFNKQLFNV